MAKYSDLFRIRLSGGKKCHCSFNGGTNVLHFCAVKLAGISVIKAVAEVIYIAV